ncbi:MAG TPA: enolase C-terminal domain-like protein [Candidatus Acidoferrales bacterium]|nr:enolase C-terminal domain-like protein [Candidatus Acidoferrales bacterium]
MRIVDICEKAIPISRYGDPSIPSGGLDTSIVAVITDVRREGRAVVGYGFTSIGRFAQGGLIHERFAPRLLAASESELVAERGTGIDPFRAWEVMMKGEKPGGHGERCVAVGALDMAIWDAAAKSAGIPLYRLLAENLGRECPASTPVRAYASGGYRYPSDDIARLREEVRRLLARGYSHLKIKIGVAPLGVTPLQEDLARIEAALSLLPSSGSLAVDAMNAYDARQATSAAGALADFGLWWFEDICDPLDFATLAAVASHYPGALAAGEALFSAAEAKLLDAYGGLRRERDILQFDPAHCYGVSGYLRIVQTLLAAGWSRNAFWPHGGHLYTLHLVAALGLGGCEMNPLSFQPFGGLSDGVDPHDGSITAPEVPGIGFETKAELYRLFRSLHD